MPRGISSTAIVQAGSENAYYTELYTVAISGQPTLYLAPMLPVSGTVALTFGGEIYTTFPITRSVMRSTSDLEVDNLVVRFQNVDQVFGALLENNDLRGARVTISGVFLASGTNAPVTQSNADLVPIFNGNVGAIQVSEQEVSISLGFPVRDIRTVVPRRFYGPGDGFNFTPVL